jgi:hypothetical protein
LGKRYIGQIRTAPCRWGDRHLWAAFFQWPIRAKLDGLS